MKLFQQLMVIGISSALFSGIYSMCSSPQNVEIGTTAIVGCSFPFSFNGVFWSLSSRAGDDVLIRLEKQPSGNFYKSGDGFANGSFDILLNGSLVIRNVSHEFDTVFKVIVISDNYTVYEHKVETVAIMHSKQLVPLINGCGNDDLCYISYRNQSILNCTVHGARPAVKLKWYKRSHDKNEELEVSVITYRNRKYGFSSVASLDVSNFSRPLTTLQCKAFGNFLHSNAIEIDVIIDNSASYNNSWCNTRVTEKQVILYSNVLIQCTVEATPDIFLWKLLQRNSSRVLMFSAFGNSRYVETTNETRHHGNGSIVLANIQPWQSKKKYFCVYAYANGYSCTKVQLVVSDKKMSEYVSGKRVKITVASSVCLLLVLFLVGVFIVFLSKKNRKRYQTVPRDLPLQEIQELQTEEKEDKPTFLQRCEEMADIILHWPFRLQPGTLLFKEEVIEMFRIISATNEKNRKRKNIGVAAGSGAGILAGGLAITGAVLAPFTFGASLGLTITGAVIGAGAAGTSLGFTFDKRSRDKKLRKMIAAELQSFILLQEDLARVIVRLAIIYGMIDVGNDLKVEDDQDLEDNKVLVDSCLPEIKKNQNDGTDLLGKIDCTKQYSKRLMNTLEEALKKKVQHDRWWEWKIKESEERPFDFLSIALADILLERLDESKTPVPSFIDFTQAVFLYQKNEERPNNSAADMAPGIVGGTRIAGGAMFAFGRAALRVANIGDDVARIGGSVARFAQGVSVAGSVLSGLGIVVDIAFLGHAIYDLTRVEKEEFSNAVLEVADIMENLNNIALEFTLDPSEDEESVSKNRKDGSDPLSVSPC